MTFRMQQQLQEFDFEVVHRAGAKHGNADGLSRMLEEGPDWQPGEKEEAFGPCPQAIPLEEASRRVGWSQTDIVATFSDSDVPDDKEAISWERTPLEISSLQKEDESIARVFYWAELYGESSDMPSLGTNLIPKEQAVQYGPEVLAYWSKRNELTIRGGILFKKCFPNERTIPDMFFRQ